MSDLGEVFDAMREDSRARRAGYRDYAPTKLRSSGVSFESHNKDAHIVIYESPGTPRAVADFWPGTGLWIWRADRRTRGRGIKNLIRFLREKGFTR